MLPSSSAFIKSYFGEWKSWIHAVHSVPKRLIWSLQFYSGNKEALCMNITSYCSDRMKGWLHIIVEVLKWWYFWQPLKAAKDTWSVIADFSEILLRNWAHIVLKIKLVLLHVSLLSLLLTFNLFSEIKPRLKKDKWEFSAPLSSSLFCTFEN